MSARNAQPDPVPALPRRLRDLPRCVQAALCTFEALRRLGYAADDIYFGHATNAATHEDVDRAAGTSFAAVDWRPAIIVTLRRPEGEFTVNCYDDARELPRVKDDDGVARARSLAQITALLARAGELWNKAPESDLEHVWARSAFVREGAALELVTGLAAKGIRTPKRASR